MTSEADRSTAGEREALRLAEHLTDVALGQYVEPRCDLTADSGDPGRRNDDLKGRVGRCSREAVAVKWEDGFADLVCREHGDRAEERGALVVSARRHDGQETQLMNNLPATPPADSASESLREVLVGIAWDIRPSELDLNRIMTMVERHFATRPTTTGARQADERHLPNHRG